MHLRSFVFQKTCTFSSWFFRERHTWSSRRNDICVWTVTFVCDLWHLLWHLLIDNSWWRIIWDLLRHISSFTRAKLHRMNNFFCIDKVYMQSIQIYFYYEFNTNKNHTTSSEILYFFISIIDKFKLSNSYMKINFFD